MIDREKKILDILKDEEMHGYEIVVRLSKDPEVSIEHRVGTLYPMLRSMEKRKMLKSYEINKNGKSRIYYKCIRKLGGGTDES